MFGFFWRKMVAFSERIFALPSHPCRLWTFSRPGEPMSCLGSCCKVSRWKSKFLRKSFPGGSDGKESACNTGNLGWKDPPEKEMATYSRILAWRIPWTEEPGGLQSMGSQRVGHDWVTNTFLGWGSHVEAAVLSPSCHTPAPPSLAGQYLSSVFKHGL